MAPNTLIYNLPNEVLVLIGEALPNPDLLNFAVASRRVNQACNRALYGNVDLSIHNRGRLVYGPQPEDNYNWQYSSSFRCHDVPSRAFTKQEKFLQTLMLHQEYPGFVKRLSWTLLLLNEPEWTQHSPQYPLLGPNNRPNLHIWEVFDRMVNVKNLDLAWLSHDHRNPLASRFPNALFPNATSIRLSGVMEYAFVASILAANPVKLERLIWDNVQQPPANNSLFLQAHPRQPYQQRAPAPWNNIARAPFNGNANLYFTEGPMQNLLGSVAGRFTRLRYLEIRKTAERGSAYLNQRSEWPDNHRFKDQDFYVELARFVNSHKGTLEHFIWEHGPQDFHHDPLPPVHVGTGNPLKPQSDMKFEELIWPIIARGPESCPQLKSVVIRGLHSWGLEEPVKLLWQLEPNTIEEELWKVYGDEFEVLVTEDADVLEHVGCRCRA